MEAVGYVDNLEECSHNVVVAKNKGDWINQNVASAWKPGRDLLKEV